MTTIQARIDEKSKKQAELIFNQMGITLNDGIRLFIYQTITERGLPFRPSLRAMPNDQTMQAIEEVKQGKGLKQFASVNEAMTYLMSDDE